jgi:hypothetical protein
MAGIHYWYCFELSSILQLNVTAQQDLFIDNVFIVFL